RLGLEPLTPSDGGGSLAELLNWWLVTVSAGKPSHEWAERTIKKHLLTTELAPLPLVAVSSERIEALLHRKSQEELSPQTINHLRAFLSRAFNSARRMGRYHGTNPVALVQKRRVPKVIRDILKPEGVGPMLARSLRAGARSSPPPSIRACGKASCWACSRPTWISLAAC